MTVLLVVCCLWVLAAATVAMLPTRRQYVPGLALMIAAPLLVFLLCKEVGLWAGILATLAFLSMFRNPLRYALKRALGQRPEVPK